MRVLMFCAAHRDRLVTKSEIAAQCNSSESHLAQIVNQLAQIGLLKTRRGRSGGIRLGRPMSHISVGEVFRLLEPQSSAEECFADTGKSCPKNDFCLLRTAIRDAVEAYYIRLDGVTLDDLTRKEDPLVQLFNEDPLEDTAL